MFANVGKKKTILYLTLARSSDIERAWFERERMRFPSRSFVQRCFPIFLSYQHNPCLSWYHPISLHFIDIISFFQVQINTHDESFIYHKIGFFFLFLPIFWSIIILFLYGNMVHRTKQGETTYLQIYVILVCHRKNYIWRTLFQYDFSSVRLKFKQ